MLQTRHSVPKYKRMSDIVFFFVGKFPINVNILSNKCERHLPANVSLIAPRGGETFCCSLFCFVLFVWELLVFFLLCLFDCLGVCWALLVCLSVSLSRGKRLHTPLVFIGVQLCVVGQWKYKLPCQRNIYYYSYLISENPQIISACADPKVIGERIDSKRETTLTGNSHNELHPYSS